jgi:hypothetical protein
VSEHSNPAAGGHGAQELPFKPRNVVKLVVQPGIKLNDLNLAVERAVGLAGCRACGLVGIDLQLLGGDPAYEQFRGIQGVQGVIVEAGG